MLELGLKLAFDDVKIDLTLNNYSWGKVNVDVLLNHYKNSCASLSFIYYDFHPILFFMSFQFAYLIFL